MEEVQVNSNPHSFNTIGFLFFFSPSRIYFLSHGIFSHFLNFIPNDPITIYTHPFLKSPYTRYTCHDFIVEVGRVPSIQRHFRAT